VLPHLTLSLVIVSAFAAPGFAQEAKAVAKSIQLDQKAPGYQELLSGPPASAGMKSGLVVLAPGKSVGQHSTEDHEEMVIVLALPHSKPQGGTMQKVTGLGGLFFKASDPKAQYAWYEKHLGIKSEPGSGAMFHWRDAADPEKTGMTVWSIFPQSTKYFGAGPQTFMMNFLVENLDELVKALREEGVTIDPKVEATDYGKFAWITDPEGNRIELWEPPKEK
jgi:predicted enzyme related to lactoylglutathione lyase